MSGDRLRLLEERLGEAKVCVSVGRVWGCVGGGGICMMDGLVHSSIRYLPFPYRVVRGVVGVIHSSIPCPPPYVPTYPQETAARKEKELREANEALTAELKTARAREEEAAAREGTRECVGCILCLWMGDCLLCVCVRERERVEGRWWCGGVAWLYVYDQTPPHHPYSVHID